MPGKYFDELEVGQLSAHLGRTVTEMDNVLFSALTMNTAAAAHQRGLSPARRSSGSVSSTASSPWVWPSASPCRT